MRKIIGSILAIVMIMGMMAGCGNRTEIPEGEPIIMEEYSTEEPTEIPTEKNTEVPTEPYPKMGTVIVDRLNVREEPYIDEFVTHQLEIGTRVEILEIKEASDEDDRIRQF